MIVDEFDRRDSNPVASVIADAFHDDDPVSAYLFPDAAQRKARQTAMVRELCIHRYARRADESLVARDAASGAVVGAALVTKVGGPESSVANVGGVVERCRREYGELRRRAESNFSLLFALDYQIRRPMLVERRFAAIDVSEPHVVLDYLACDPPRQGSGVGSALLKRLIETFLRDDSSHPLISLMCKSGNVDFYRRFGFVEIDHLLLPTGTMHRMVLDRAKGTRS